MSRQSQDETHDTSAPESIIAAVREACVKRESALIVSISIGASHKACFVTATDEDVSLEFEDPESGQSFQPQALALVVFQHAQRTKAFITGVRKVETRGTSRVYLRPPAGALSINGRSIVRVPLHDDHGLEVRVISGGASVIGAHPVDISEAGIQIHFDEFCDPDLEIGEVVELELVREEESVRLDALIRRRDKSTYGFSFPCCMDNGDLAPPRELRNLVARVQGQ